MAHEQDRAFGTVAVAASFLAAGLAAIYWFSRTGFVNPVEPVAKALAVSLFMIDAPYVARIVARRFGDSYRWQSSYSFYWLLAILAASFGGRLAASADLDLFLPFGIAGVMAFAITFADWLRGVKLWRSALIVLGALAFSTFAGGVVWGRIYKSPLFTEMLQANGIVHHDPVGLTAIANMLRTYGVPSVGLDGLIPMQYHWGSMWVFGQLAELTGSTSLDFYNRGYVITMLPLFFGAVLCFAMEVQRVTRRGEVVDLREKLPLLGILLVAVIGVFPITGMDKLGVWTSNLMISESYAIGIGTTLLLAGVTVAWYAGRQSGVRGPDWIFPGIVLPLGIIALGYLKISMMILGFAAVMYAALRLRLYRKPAYVAVGIVFTAAFAWTLTQVSLPQHREGFQPFDFLKGFVPPAWWPFFILAQLFWSVVYVVARMRSMGLRTLADLRVAMADRRTLDIEIVALVALLGIMPGFVTHIDGGSAFYFSDVQRWLAVGLLIALVGAPDAGLGLGRPRSSLAVILTLVIAAPLVYSMGANSVYWTKRMLAANAALRYDLYPDSVASRIPPGIRGLPQLNDAAGLQRGLEASPNYLPTVELIALSGIPSAEKKRTALFIPQSERAYWEMLQRPGACSFAGHVAPALAGMMMVDGMPPYGCELSPYYGLGFHAKRLRDQSAADTLPATLCARVARSGASRVMTLHFDQAGRARRRVDECQRAP